MSYSVPFIEVAPRGVVRRENSGIKWQRGVVFDRHVLTSFSVSFGSTIGYDDVSVFMSLGVPSPLLEFLRMTHYVSSRC